MKKVWLNVNSLEMPLPEIPATDTTGNYRLEVGSYGELYLSWQYLSGAKIWRGNTAFNEQNEQCLWGDVLLVDMGKLTLTLLESSYARDSLHKSRLARVLGLVKELAIGIAEQYLKTFIANKNLSKSRIETVREIIYSWEVRVLEKCSDKFLDKYGI